MPMANSPRHSQPIWGLSQNKPPTSVRILYQCRGCMTYPYQGTPPSGSAVVAVSKRPVATNVHRATSSRLRIHLEKLFLTDFSSAERAKLRAGEFEIEWFSTPVGWSSPSHTSQAPLTAIERTSVQVLRIARADVLVDARR